MVVYFLEIGNRIKIGYASNLANRMQHYPPHSELLATRRGGMATEAYELNKWHAHLANGREWFYPAAELRQYIATLGDPEPVEDVITTGEPLPIGTQLGPILRYLREDAGWSQSRLAEESGVTRELVARTESYKPSNVTTKNLFAMVKALGYSLEIRKN